MLSKLQYEKVETTEGYFKKKAVSKYCLTEKSYPHEFVEVFFPFRKKMKKSQNGGADKEWLSIEQLTKWSRFHVLDHHFVKQTLGQP